MKIDKKDFVVCLLFFLITLVFFFRFLDGRELFTFKDLSRFFHPLRSLMVDQAREGYWPLWNPYIFYGMPLMADLQVGFFYPLTIIYYLLPFDLAFNYYIILHYFLAACFMCCFMRYIKSSYFASFISAFIFAFSGYLLSVSNMNTSLSSVIWLPLVLLFWDKVLTPSRLCRATPLHKMERGDIYTQKDDPLSIKWRGEERGEDREDKRKFPPFPSFSLIILLSIMFLGGEPTIIYATGFVLFFWAMVFVEGGQGKLKAAALLILLAAAAACLAAVQLIPFAELSALSNRMTFSQFNIVTIRSFPIREVLGFFMPYFFGNQLRGGSYSPVFLGHQIQDWLISPYLGILPFIFLFFGKMRKTSWFFIGLAAFSLIIAFGKYTPLFFILYKILPGFSMIRYPVKYLFLTTFSLAALAGIGYDESLKNEKLMRRGAFILFCSFVLLFAVYLLGINFLPHIFLFIKMRYPGIHPMFAAILWANLKFDLQSLLYLTLIIASCAALFLFRAKNIIKDLAFGTVILGIVFFDLLSNNAPLSVPSDPRIYHEITPNVKLLLSEAGINRYFYTSDVERHNRMAYGEDYDQGLLEAKDKLAACRLVSHKLYDAYGYESIELQDHTTFYLRFFEKDPFKNIKMINMVNAKYLADMRPIGIPGLRLKKRSRYYYGTLYLYENPYVLPRAYLVGSYRLVKNRKDTLSAMGEKNFDPKKFIVLEEKPEVEGGQKYKEAKIISYRPMEVLLEAGLNKPGFLFLSDTYYPGWKAYVDGREVKIYRANYMFRAVALKKGKHLVRFVYDPLSFKLGLSISVITFLVLAFASWKFRCE